MKRSRIFLGATTALLAIAGVAAAKASHFVGTPTRYYCTAVVDMFPHSKCLPYAKINCIVTNGNTVCKGSDGTHLYTLYTTKLVGKDTCGTINTPTGSCAGVVKYGLLNQ